MSIVAGLAAFLLQSAGAAPPLQAPELVVSTTTIDYSVEGAAQPQLSTTLVSARAPQGRLRDLETRTCTVADGASPIAGADTLCLPPSSSAPHPGGAGAEPVREGAKR